MSESTTVDGTAPAPENRAGRGSGSEEVGSASREVVARSAAARPTLLYRLLALILVPAFRVVFRLRAVGVENLPEGGFILCANQMSNLDALVLAATVYPRPLSSMGKAELFTRFLGPVMRAIGSFPVHRDRIDTAAIEIAVARARAGEGIVIFPEGTRRAKGWGKQREAVPHTGPAFVALLAGVPLVPAAIRGTEALTRLRPWRIAYGAPLDPSELDGLQRREARRILTERMWHAVLELEAGLAREEDVAG